MERRELPEGWVWKRLGDVAEVFNGVTPSKSEQRENGHSVLKIKDIDENGQFKNNQKSFVDNAFFLENQKKILKNGDTLILNAAHNSEYVSSKKCYISNFSENVLATGEWMIIREKSCSIDSKFIFFLLTSASISLKIKNIVKGIHLYPKDMANLTIPLPPLPIQRQIVAVLEHVDEVKRQRREADDLTGALLQSVFYEMFGDPVRNENGWETIEFGDIIKETKNGLYKNEKFLGKGTPILRMYNIYRNRIVLDKYHLITATKDEIQEYLVKPGDILFNRVNSRIWLGKCAVIPKDIGEFLFESKNIRIRLDRSKADPEYIVWYLSTPAGRQEILKRAKDAVNQSTVNNTDLREFKIRLPPLALQQQFACIVEEVERIRERQAASGKEIEGLCGGLMQRAFGGELIA